MQDNMEVEEAQKLRKLLHHAVKIAKELRVFTSTALAKKLGVDRRTAELLIGLMLAKGLIKEASESPCQYCPLAKICGGERRKSCPFLHTVRVYVASG